LARLTFFGTRTHEGRGAGRTTWVVRSRVLSLVHVVGPTLATTRLGGASLRRLRRSLNHVVRVRMADHVVGTRVGVCHVVRVVSADHVRLSQNSISLS
jgi:hypothetical protein